MANLNLKKTWVWLTLVLGFLAFINPLSPALAGCVTSGSTETCTGDLDPVINNSTNIHTSIVKELTDDIEGTDSLDPLVLQDVGADGAANEDPGDDAANLEVDFDGLAFGLLPTDGHITILVKSQGGDGHVGDDDGGSNNNGHPGGDGGIGGDVVVNFTSGGITTPPTTPGTDIILILSQGGDGGKGGIAEGGVTSKNIGGNGGDGGTAGDATLNLTTGTFDLSNANNGFVVKTIGGAGAIGGNATASDSNSSHAGHGGAGGAAGTATITLGDSDSGSAVTFTMTASNLGLVATSTGGLGGDSSSVASDFFNADGEPAGDGGASSGAEITITGGSAIEINSGNIGVLVESVGGNGGNGGEAKDTTADGTGGKGGTGGDSGPAKITVEDSSSLTVTTSGTNRHAVSVASLAGNGGKGGESDLEGGDAKGGNGGPGGTGGNVTVNVENTTLVTAGNQAQGVLAQSFGGAGGEGGDAKGGLSGSGGSSEAPGPGGTVDVSFEGDITTGGNEANGILAQSVGGFAGDAGSASAAFVAYGASGESGGDADDVTVILKQGSSITTTGNYSTGIEAQSTGGGGGKGGSSSAIDALGGTGSAGGDGGTVSVSAFFTTITTSGEQARGISASSIGGGGGNAGSSSGVSAIGGQGGTGGDGGTSSVTSVATIVTTGDYADGIFSQSVGGGGGSAHSTSGIVAIGGKGGDGGNGMDASVTINGGSISTTGTSADGVFIQSIGGGGGNGSNAIAVGAEFSYAVGGQGGDGGTGGDVTFSDNVANPYNISTTGDTAYGLFAQSVGGGGGHGGNAIAASAGLILDFSMGASGDGGTGGDGGVVTVDTDAIISTAGPNSTALFAQSIGGGGGSAGTTVASANDLVGSSISLAVGGKGGHAGDGGTVSVTTESAITTTGDNSFGILGQSVGGGGGHSGTTVAGSVLSTTGSLDLAVGGKGGSGGDGGVVNVTQGGTVSTTGDNAPAVFGQSLGGGGGYSGATVSGSGFSLTSLNLALGADGGSAGDGMAVTVTSSADVTTTGHNSSGVIAQSIGGAGGMSGLTASGAAIDSGDLGITIGGNGGDGGIGGTVMLSTAANTTISTTGHNSYGLLAQSLGGTGGVSGTSLTADGGSGGTIAITVEGNGGTGGSSGDVTVDNAATINTSGTYSDAILAQSLAGGGGSATAAISISGVSIGSFSSAIGGAGGKGGTGGTVTVENTGALTTGNPYATGILAQSLGGNGGNGGMAVDAGATIGPYVSGNMSVTVGGDGGDGGTAGDVMITNSGAISTADFASLGIFAQSIGGDGGNGGSAIAGVITVSGDVSVDVEFTLGGSGGDSGMGGDVTVTNNTGGDISTTGALAQGILAQSIGGNGGNGGSAYTGIFDIGGAKATVNVEITVGGKGGDGAVGGKVEVDNAATITTKGISSPGIYAQSIGGNGGNGGNAINAIGVFQGAAGEGYNGKLKVAIGGAGGTASDGGTVMVKNSGAITTKEAVSTAIFAQSVGGGGGDGGSAGTTSLSGSFGSGTASDPENQGFTSFSFSLTVGGSGGAAGDGEKVTVTNSGDLETAGIAAYGIFAQSVGGGGGNGGNGQASTGAVSTGSTLDELIEILEDVKDAYAAYKDLSNFWSGWSVDVGGSGGASGIGGDVMIQNDGDITTTGISGTAIFAQSIGGGGGNGGDGVGGLITTFVVGGSSGGGGNGGDVTIDNTGTLSTTGLGAMGIFAHSVGGGGGTAGDIEMTFLEEFTKINIGVGLIVQGDPGNGGDGGDVSVTSSGEIKTTGTAAPGIFAQSVGGSGGAGGINGFAGAIGFAGSAQSAGNGGKVTVTTTAPITVTGDYSVGIFAQSVGGDLSGTTADKVTISIGGDITASGTGARAILVQSQGHDSNGVIDITIAEGVTVSTTEEGYETIGIMDGFTNKIINNGTIEKAEGETVNGYAVITNTDGALLEIDNFGTFTGSVSLDNGHFNIFNNQAGATLNLGLEFDLGMNSAVLTNDGTMSPAGSGVISTSTIMGTVTQSATGTYLVDLSMGTSPTDGSGDQLILETTGASFAGTIAPNLVDDNMLASGESGQVLIAFTNVNNSTLTSTATVADTATVDYSLLTGTNSFGGQSLALKYTVDLSGLSLPAPLPNNMNTLTVIRPNHLRFANHLSDLVIYARTSLVPGSAEHSLILNLVNSALTIGTFAELNQLYTALTAEELNLTSFGTTLAVLDFHRSMQSCAAYGENGLANFNRQGRCVWGRIQGSTFKQKSNSPDRVAYNQDSFSFATGVQVARSDTLFFGLGVAYDHRDSSNSVFNGENSTFQLGAVMKKIVGDWTISGTVSVGIFDAETSRTVVTPMETFTAHANPDGGFFSFQLRVDKTISGDGWYVKPIVAFTLVQFWQDSFSETTTGSFGLDVQSVSDVSLIAQPALEFGGELFGPKSRAFVRVGAYIYVADRSTPIDFRFSSLGVSSPLITLHDTPDTTHGELAVGFDFDLGGGKSFSMMAEGTLAKNSHSFGGSAKFRFKF